jgi:spermidine synthase
MKFVVDIFQGCVYTLGLPVEVIHFGASAVELQGRPDRTGRQYAGGNSDHGQHDTYVYFKTPHPVSVARALRSGCEKIHGSYTVKVADTILFDGDTGLEHYLVVDTIYEGRPARMLYSGQRHTAQSGVATDGQADLLFDYNQRYIEILESMPASRILVIGGGAYTFPMAVLQGFPEVRVDVVEIDPGLKSIAEKFFGLSPNPRLRIFHEEGSKFLRTTGDVYDAIFVDAFTRAVIPETLTSADTVRCLHGRLAGRGVAAVNVISPFRGPNAALIRDLAEKYGAVFRTVDVYPAGRSLFSLWLPQNLVLVAQKGASHELLLRYGKLPDAATE